MLPHEVAAATTIAAIYAEDVVYTGAGLFEEPVKAVPTFAEVAGEYSAQRRMFEIAFEQLPEDPIKGNEIVHGGFAWRVTEARRADDVGAWQLFVEKAGNAP